MKQDIAIFTPMANEEKNAKKFVLEVLSYQKFFRKFKYFLILDNASKDSTFEIVKKLEKKNKNLKVVWCPNNKTVVDAYMEGYKNCYKTKFKWILEIDDTDLNKWFQKNSKVFKHFGRDIEQLFSYIKISHGRRIYGKSPELRKHIIMVDLENGFKQFNDNNLKQETPELIGLYV